MHVVPLFYQTNNEKSWRGDIQVGVKTEEQQLLGQFQGVRREKIILQEEKKISMSALMDRVSTLERILGARRTAEIIERPLEVVNEVSSTVVGGSTKDFEV
jgi:cystathionine beta-lyase family protein involved in aluminum resistance